MNNDLISREALAKSMRKSINERYKNWGKSITVADIATLIFDEIDNAPTVTPKQGEWKVYGRQGGIPITDRCTNCKYEMMWYKNKHNYCPNCGANMRKGGAV